MLTRHVLDHLFRREAIGRGTPVSDEYSAAVIPSDDCCGQDRVIHEVSSQGMLLNEPRMNWDCLINIALSIQFKGLCINLKDHDAPDLPSSRTHPVD